MKNKYVIFAGGETAGPIVPLLALAKLWQEKDQNVKPVFVDRRQSVAARLVPQRKFIFTSIITGKLRRYLSVSNIFSPLLILIGFIQSLILLRRYRPIAVIGAGGYVQVPVIFAAWILNIPRFIHQHDIVPTFSNQLVAIFANRITTTFEKSLKDFRQGSGFERSYEGRNKIFWTGSPNDLDAKTLNSTNAKEEAYEFFKLDKKLPTILVFGGGSGARGLNQAIIHNLPDLVKVGQVLHSTGAGKSLPLEQHDNPEIHDRYHQYEFIDRWDLAYAAADIVIARAGVSTISDLATLGKQAIIVPMPNSHQESNAKYLEQHQAAVVVNQKDLYNGELAKIIKIIFFDAKLQKALSANIRKIMPDNAGERMLKVIQDELNDK